MKQIKTLVALSILTISVLSCRKDDIATPTKGTVEFSFTLSTTKSTKADPGTPTAVIISAEDLNGQSVYKNEQVTVELLGNNYSSKALEFDPGTYHLTKFQVVDANGIVLNATPMGFSSNANLVENPLPIKFNVQRGYTTKLLPEILSTQNSVPQSFGYASFDINNQSSYVFQLEVYLFNNNTNQLELTNASLTIASEGGATINKNLSASIDTITLKEANSYILSVSKDGYQTWIDTVSTNDLMRYFTNSYKVTLDKVGENNFSFTTKQDTLTKVIVTMKNSDNITPMRVNWGDGTIEITSANGKLIHDYKYIGSYKPRITGNIGTITSLTATNCQIASINLEKALGLTSVDLSRNQVLKTLSLNSMPQLKEVICVQGGLENLVIANCENVETVHCSLNNLNSLDISTLPKLKNLYCDRNNLTNINVSSNLSLSVLYCYQNNLTALDVTSNSALVTLDCRNNKLTFVDISKATSINNLLLGNNTISNTDANKILVDLLNNVKSNPRSGQISLSVAVKGDGQTAKDNLEKTYLWTVSTY